MEEKTGAFNEPKKQQGGKQVSLRLFVTSLVLVALVGFVFGTRSDTLLANIPWLSQKNPSQLDLTAVQQTYEVLRKKYDGTLDTTKLIEGAQRGLVEATGDPYTAYFSDEEAKEFFDGLEGTFSGIGAELGKKDDRVFIVSVIDDSPAKKSGIQAGDILVKVNDQDASTWSIDKAVTEIRGEKGTTVKLTLLRGVELKEFSIVRDQITTPSVTHEVTSDGIGIMRISRFGETDTVNLAEKAAEEFKAKNVKGVVLDLRGNGGGYLNAAKEISGLWLENKVVVTERSKGVVSETLRTGNSALLKDVPTAVLVDGGSASASEILAGALKDNKAATLIGVKTFGKGSVQTIEELIGGGQLKVTVAKWYTPNGKNINKEGITPDTIVESTAEDLSAGRDPQKDKALELLRKAN